MGEEQKAEATPVVAQAKEPTIEELVSKSKQLETDLATAKSEADTAKREAKSHQEYGRKQHEELEKQKKLDAEVSLLKTQLQVQTEMIAALMDKEGETEDEVVPKKRRSEEYLAKLKGTPAVDPQVEARNQAAEEADELAKSVGLKMDESPELEKALMWFSMWNYKKGLEETKKVVEAKKVETPKTEAKVEPSDEDKEKIALEYMKAKGLLKSDTGLPSGGGSKTDSEVIKNYADNPHDRGAKEAYSSLMRSRKK